MVFLEKARKKLITRYDWLETNNIFKNIQEPKVFKPITVKLQRKWEP